MIKINPKLNINYASVKNSGVSAAFQGSQNNPVQNNPLPTVNFSQAPNQAVNQVPAIRTTLSGSKEQKQYTEIMNKLNPATRQNLGMLLKTGVLLNNNSNDNSSVLDNLHKIITTPRARGLDSDKLLEEAVMTLANPFIITQKFGDMPDKIAAEILKNPENYQIPDPDRGNSTGQRYTKDDLNVKSSSCVAASIEFNLASKMPAEFSKMANDLSSEKLSTTKKLKMNSIADSFVEAKWMLSAFKTPHKILDWDDIEVELSPDRNAIVRARVQNSYKDANERSMLDVLMQSTFMNIASQQTYNSLTDTRTGKFNPNNLGLSDMEKNYAEILATGKRSVSIIYQTLDMQGNISYNTDFKTTKKHITDALKMNENVIIGYAELDEEGRFLNGHEITIVDIEKDAKGNEYFVCNDTDDNSIKPKKYAVDEFLPLINHAGLPKEVLKDDVQFIDNWVEVLECYQNAKQEAQQAA